MFIISHELVAFIISFDLSKQLFFILFLQYLTFPSANGEQKFSFQINESKDQGPQGSLECVQQNSQRTLETLGTLPYRMRIQANDDVYETTRHKMAKETENSKTKW